MLDNGKYLKAQGLVDASGNHIKLAAHPTWCARATCIGLDLTLLIRSKETGFPSVVDGKPYKQVIVRSNRERAKWWIK